MIWLLIPVAFFGTMLTLAWNNEKRMHSGCRKLLWIWNRQHVQDPGYCNSPGYGDLHNRGSDGTGRLHGSLYTRCSRCNTDFHLISVHAHRPVYNS